jgi:tRNA pseudouridine32 synthase/23S rRNA pseudouridine746 synthase
MRTRPPPLDYRPPAEPFLPLVHVDEDILVFDKPSGLLSVPGKTPDLADCAESRAQRDWPDALIVHRLDMDTSGLILMARNKRAQRIISGQFAKRIIQKTYYAMVEGEPEADEGEINLPLIADWPNRPLQMVCYERGKQAKTLWQVAARHTGKTLMRLKPETGRSHQLRVHMAEIGLPILGDAFYATPTALAAASRLMLHAARLSWRSPEDGEWVVVVSNHNRALDPVPFEI